MSVGFTVPTGIACGDCDATEQDCARNYPCCTECSHFTEPEQPLDLTPDRPPRRPEQLMTTPTPLTRDTLAELLARARPLTDTKIRRAVERVDHAHDQLRTALADHAVRDAARHDVERLERQLAEARKKLRGGGSASRRISPRHSVRQRVRSDLHQHRVAHQARSRLHRRSVTRP